MKRNASIELFRCMLMLAIVMHHCFIYGIYSNAHGLWTALFTTLICWHVDSFVSITGWFGIKFSWKKVFALYGQILFYSLINFWYCGKFDVTGGWFGCTYLALLFISPFLNSAIEKLVEGPKKELLFVYGLFAAVITLSWLPTHAYTGMSPEGVDGHSLILFVFIYFTMRSIKLAFVGQLPKKVLALGLAVFAGMFVLFGVINVVFSHPDGIGRVFASYDGPHVWIMAASLLLFFVWYVKVSDAISKIAAFCGPSMFGVYLFHDTTSIGREMVSGLEMFLSLHFGTWHPAIIIFVAGLMVFLTSFAVDLVRRMIFKLLGGVWQRRLR